MHSYLQLLERLEVAGNRYRRATDLLKYSSSSLERSLAESHLQLARQFLESEFELAEVESKSLALQSKPGTSEGGVCSNCRRAKPVRQDRSGSLAPLG